MLESDNRGLHNCSSDCIAEAEGEFVMASGWVTDLGRSLLSFLVGGSGGGGNTTGCGSVSRCYGSWSFKQGKSAFTPLAFD